MTIEQVSANEDARYEVEQYYEDDLISYQEYQACLESIERESMLAY